MANLLEVCMKQGAVIEFLVVEGETPINIHKRMQTVFKDETLDYSIVWKGAQHPIKNFLTFKKLQMQL